MACAIVLHDHHHWSEYQYESWFNQIKKNVKNAIINNKYKTKVFKWDDKRTTNGVAVFNSGEN